MSSASQIIHGTSAQQVASEYADKYALPLGAKISVTNIDGSPSHFEVERSMRSYDLKNGGRVHVKPHALPPLTGGGVAPHALERDHVIDAQSASHAAMLFARESGVPTGTHLYVTDPKGRGSYFETH